VIERILPEPDHFATCPMDGNILNYYKGEFDSVFVMLHPFIRPISISKELFRPDTYPNRVSIAIGCEAIRWSKIISLTGLSSLAAVDVGLRTQIGGLNKRVANEEYAKCLEVLYDSHGIVQPDEGHFSDLLHDFVLQCFQDLGHQWVWVGDELGTERKLYWIDDLKVKDLTATMGHCNVFTPDKSLLWTTHWDSHFSFLCGTHEVLARLVQSVNLEGFFCEPNTEVYWSLQQPKLDIE